MDDSVPIEYVPDGLAGDKFSPLNDQSAVGLRQAINDANEYASEFETWQVVYCKSRAAGINQVASAKAAKKSMKECSQFEKTLGFKELAGRFLYIESLKSPVPENVREKMLWRIAVRNELEDPDIARKAVNDINTMHKQAGGGGQVINIQINNELLPRGALDG